MKLNYIALPENVAGVAIYGCGTIHKSEIYDTLTQLSIDLRLLFNLNDYILGSTGKREYSGDIDIVLDSSLYSSGYKTFYNDLVGQFGSANVAKNGEMVHLKYPIIGFDRNLQDSLPRNGFVQIDFNFGNAEWERLYHFSPGPDSAYKGAHRNLAIAGICRATSTLSVELDHLNRPVSLIKWKWGPKGFVKINRHSFHDRKQYDEIIEGPYFDGNKIASILFPINGRIADLNSLETIITAVKTNYSEKDQEFIWECMANNFFDWKDGRNFIYPAEISFYFA